MERRVQIFAGLAALGRRDTKMSSDESVMAIVRSGFEGSAVQGQGGDASDARKLPPRLRGRQRHTHPCTRARLKWHLDPCMLQSWSTSTGCSAEASRKVHIGV